MSDGDCVDISPEPVSDATGELEGPEPLIDEEVPAPALGQIVDDYTMATGHWVDAAG